MSESARVPVVLASTSPRRRAILRMLGIDPRCVDPAGAESPYAAPADPAAYAQRQALAKLGAAGGLAEDILLVAADTVVLLGGDVLGKPKSPEHALGMLRALSDRTHEVITGVALAWRGRERSGFERTLVTFRALDEREIARYVEAGGVMDKAGAYGIQDRGAALVRRVEGCFFNVMGFPVSRWLELLRDLGLRYDPGSGSVEESAT